MEAVQKLTGELNIAAEVLQRHKKREVSTAIQSGPKACGKQREGRPPPSHLLLKQVSATSLRVHHCATKELLHSWARRLPIPHYSSEGPLRNTCPWCSHHVIS